MHRRTPAKLRLPSIQKTCFLPTFTPTLLLLHRPFLLPSPDHHLSYPSLLFLSFSPRVSPTFPVTSARHSSRGNNLHLSASLAFSKLLSRCLYVSLFLEFQRRRYQPPFFEASLHTRLTRRSLDASDQLRGESNGADSRVERFVTVLSFRFGSVINFSAIGVNFCSPEIIFNPDDRVC